MKKIVVTIFSLALFLVANAAFADLKIGVIDLNKILASSSKVSDAKAQLKKQFEPKAKEINDAQKKLKSDIDNYSKNSPTMKSDDSKALQQKIMDEQKKLQEMEGNFQNDVTTAQNKAMDDIMKHVEDVVNKVAAKEKYDFVLTKMSAAYSDPKFDITDEVIKEMK